jgi:flagellum-specific peptidoglycan hydrolase FlgJ
MNVFIKRLNQYNFNLSKLRSNYVILHSSIILDQAILLSSVLKKIVNISDLHQKSVTNLFNVKYVNTNGLIPNIMSNKV